MNHYQIEVRVTPRPGLLDPEGKAIDHALASLGYEGVGGVRVGKVIVIELEAASEEQARERAEEMCRKLLANPVTEDFAVEVAPADPAGAGARGSER
ncbi:MAG: phosphoribosylformylglycinamidine synthase subunit PurS [Gemmatimonadota bacterium]